MKTSIVTKAKILVIVGPTASGKSGLAVKLAKEFDGEVISADSRQVYKGLTIGTGKITKKEMKGVRHHLIDVADPRRQFTVAKYVKLAQKTIQTILKRGRLPIICGGTGFYVEALVDGIALPDVPADTKLRARLSKLSAEKLLKQLKKLDPVRAHQINQNTSDRHNARRIIRAIEIATARKRTEPVVKKPLYNPIFIGLKVPREELKKKIKTRLLKRLRSGMIAEARRLRAQGLSWKRMEELGLEYRYLARFLQGKMDKSAMIKKLEIEIGRYAKRQMTWFRRDTRIRWFGRGEDMRTYIDIMCQIK